jgi:hypothetical protein
MEESKTVKSVGDPLCTAHRSCGSGFVVGSGLGAWCQAHVGLWSLVMPSGLALAALAITYGSR